jgi:RAT1-interacting protein
VPSGLLPYKSPALPADLNEGFETSYTKKDDSQLAPVDTIIQAGKAAAVDWSKVGLCTYRNNLNKILLTPLALDNEWAVDACFWDGTLFLDINKAGHQEYPNQDKFVYYGKAPT